jgi:hypothetical protein
MSYFEIVICLISAPIAVAAVVIIIGAWQHHSAERKKEEKEKAIQAEIDAGPPVVLPKPEPKPVIIEDYDQNDIRVATDIVRIEQALQTLASSNNTIMQALQVKDKQIEEIGTAFEHTNRQFPMIADAISQLQAQINAMNELFNQRLADTRPYTTASDNVPRTPSGKRAYGSVQEYMENAPKLNRVQQVGQAGQVVGQGDEVSVEDPPEYEVDEIGRAIVPIARPEPAPEPVMPPKKRSRKK